MRPPRPNTIMTLLVGDFIGGIQGGLVVAGFQLVFALVLLGLAVWALRDESVGR